METALVREVRDLKLRSLLIQVAGWLESQMESLSSGSLKLNPTTTPIGLEIRISWKKKDSGPTIFRFDYSINRKAFEGWCVANKWMLEGPLMITVKGVNINIPFGPGSWEQSGFYIQDGKGAEAREVWLKLLDHPVSFLVHREITEQREWEVFLEG